MDVRTSVSTITLVLVLLCSSATGDDLPPNIFDDVNTDLLSTAQLYTTDEGEEENADIFREIISRLMGRIQPIDTNDLDRSTTHRLLASISGDSNHFRSSPRLHPEDFDINIGANIDVDPTSSVGSRLLDYAKRGCRGRKCRNVGGSNPLNPGANVHPVMFGKRSRVLPQHIFTPSATESDLSNKRGRAQRRLRVRVPPRADFLPFGRR